MESLNTAKRSEKVVVVGGGIIGIACAHYLNEAGFQVTVIDQGEIGQGCSYANCGFICPSDVLPLTEPGAVMTGLKSLFDPDAAFRIKPQLRLSLYQWLLQFARRCNKRQMIWAGRQLHTLFESSVSEYQRLFEEDNFDVEWKQKGLLYVLQSEQGLKTFRHTEQLLADNYGLQAHEIAGEQLQSFDPAFKQGLAGAFWYQQDSSLRSDKLILSWRQQLEGKGVCFKEHCRLERIGKSAETITYLETSQGNIFADHYVVAAGAWSSKLAHQLDCKIPVEPGKGYSLTMSKPENCPNYPMLFPEHRIGVTPFDESYRIASMMEFSGYNTEIPPRRIDQLKRSAEPYLLTPHGETIQETWYGWRPMTWDSLPIIGRVPGLSNAVLATGHNMLGLSLAPVTGKLISEIIQEGDSHIALDAFSPSRF